MVAPQDVLCEVETRFGRPRRFTVLQSDVDTYTRSLRRPLLLEVERAGSLPT